MSNWKDDTILVWIDVFTKPDSSWRKVRNEQNWSKRTPQTEEERRAFEALIAKENRELLKAWYAQFPSVNQTADSFRRILERAIGESLPLAKK